MSCLKSTTSIQLIALCKSLSIELLSSKMSNKYGVRSATYTVPLNNEKDTFATSCGHLQHFLHINGYHDKSTGCKPMMFRMHLELVGSPETEAADGNIIEHDKSKNIKKKSVEYLKEDLKSLNDALKTTDNVVNMLRLHLEKLERHDVVDQTAVVSIKTNQVNSIDKQQIIPLINNSSEKLTYDGSNKSNEYNDNEDIASDGKGGERGVALDEKAQCDEENYVTIWYFKTSDSSKDTAIDNVIGLAELMGLRLTHDQIKDIDVCVIDQYFLNYVVEFYTKHLKDAFLENVHILQDFPNTKFLEIY